MAKWRRKRKEKGGTIGIVTNLGNRTKCTSERESLVWQVKFPQPADSTGNKADASHCKSVDNIITGKIIQMLRYISFYSTLTSLHRSKGEEITGTSCIPSGRFTRTAPREGRSVSPLCKLFRHATFISSQHLFSLKKCPPNSTILFDNKLHHTNKLESPSEWRKPFSKEGNKQPRNHNGYTCSE